MLSCVFEIRAFFYLTNLHSCNGCSVLSGVTDPECVESRKIHAFEVNEERKKRKIRSESLVLKTFSYVSLYRISVTQDEQTDSPELFQE